MVTISEQSAGILYVLTILRGVEPALRVYPGIPRKEPTIHIAIVATSSPYDSSNPCGRKPMEQPIPDPNMRI